MLSYWSGAALLCKSSVTIRKMDDLSSYWLMQDVRSLYDQEVRTTSHVTRVPCTYKYYDRTFKSIWPHDFNIYIYIYTMMRKTMRYINLLSILLKPLINYSYVNHSSNESGQIKRIHTSSMYLINSNSSSLK